MAKGFLQREGTDALESFSPTPVPSSIRIIVITALERGWVLNHWEIEQAFIQSEIDREISLRCLMDVASSRVGF